MNEKSAESGGAPVNTANGRKLYKAPVLKLFGSVRDLTTGKGSANGDTGQIMMVPSSDRRLKENIVEIGRHPLGIGLFLFDYKPEFRAECGHGRHFGVMADEVETVMPDAVSSRADGYQRVDYRLLGIALPAAQGA